MYNRLSPDQAEDLSRCLPIFVPDHGEHEVSARSDDDLRLLQAAGAVIEITNHRYRNVRLTSWAWQRYAS